MTEDEESGPQEGREEDLELPRIERVADLDVDEDAIAEAAESSPVMEGFQTGSDFEVEGPPDEVDRDVEIETMEIRSKAFNELDFQQAETSGSEELGGKDLVVDRDFGRTDGGDDGSLSLPTPTPPKAKPMARHRGLEELERRRKRRSGARRLVTATATVLITLPEALVAEGHQLSRAGRLLQGLPFE